MELSFSRGFSPGWFGGCDHKMLVPAISSAKRGVFLGTIKYVDDAAVAAVALQDLARAADSGDTATGNTDGFNGSLPN